VCCTGIAWFGAIIPAIFGLYYLVFFKMGPQPFSLLPSLSLFPSEGFVGSDAYLSFKCAVYLSGALQCIYITHCVIHQCCVDVFFIDWERPRGYLRETPSSAAVASGRKRGAKKPTPVSAWRTIMMANEWCKLGTARKTSVELTLITLVFVLVGCDFQYVAVPRPNSLARDEGPRNVLLDFGNNVVWFVIILAAQRMGIWVLQRCVLDNPPILFVDLCTIAKVSVMVLDQRNRGYYLHCRSPYQYADGGLKDLLTQLAQEEENLTAARGLEDGNTTGAGEGGGGGGGGGSKGVDEACQTFEIYVTRKWRDAYDKLYKTAMEEHLQKASTEEGALAKNLQGARSIRRGKGDVPPEQLHEASSAISEFLRSFFDNAMPNHRWVGQGGCGCAAYKSSAEGAEALLDLAWRAVE
jgi:meckelin